jgi:hypothetical protein
MNTTREPGQELEYEERNSTRSFKTIAEQTQKLPIKKSVTTIQDNKENLIFNAN